MCSPHPPTYILSLLIDECHEYHDANMEWLGRLYIVKDLFELFAQQ